MISITAAANRTVFCDEQVTFGSTHQTNIASEGNCPVFNLEMMSFTPVVNPNVFTPKRLMILAAVGFGIVSFLAYHWLSQPILTTADVTQFQGTIKEARELSGDNGYLEITLADQPYPFRCFSSLYPHAFKFDLHGRIGIGTPVSIGVATSEAGSPRRNWVQNQKFYSLITLSIAGSEVLSLDAHNRAVESDRRMGPWFCLVMAGICVWLFRLGFRHRHLTGSIMEIVKAKKKLA